MRDLSKPDSDSERPRRVQSRALIGVRTCTAPPRLLSTLMLCLACSSSLPPKLVNNAIFITPCCERPICPNCLSSNPRLARYNPCLHCLGGVGIVSARSPQRSTSQGQVTNLDGGVHDSDAFVLGDEDEDEELGTVQESSRYGTDPSTPPPHYELKPSSDVSPSRHRSQPSGEDSSRTSSKYYIKPGDSLLGISLKYNIDVRNYTLCSHSYSY